MGTTFENEILEIFGTTDLEQLKKNFKRCGIL